MVNFTVYKSYLNFLKNPWALRTLACPLSMGRVAPFPTAGAAVAPGSPGPAHLVLTLPPGMENEMKATQTEFNYSKAAIFWTTDRLHQAT